MNCKNAREKFDEYQENLLLPGIRKLVREHLDSCNLCTRYFLEQRELIEQCKKVAAPAKSNEEWSALHAAILANLVSQPQPSRQIPRFLAWCKNSLLYPAHRPFRFAYAAVALTLGIGAALLLAPGNKVLKGNGISIKGAGVAENQKDPLTHVLSLVQSQRTIVLKKKTPTTSKAPGAPMKSDESLENGDILQTLDGGRAMVWLDDKTVMCLNARSSLELRCLSRDDQQYYLSGGEAVFRVSKRSPGRRFSVLTPNAQCRVVGTLFRVKVSFDSAAHKPLTELAVAEGAVECAAMNKEKAPVVVASGTIVTVLGNVPGLPKTAASKEKMYLEFDSLTKSNAADLMSRPLGGRCLIQSIPANGSVYLNGAIVGLTPLNLLVPAGKIKISVIKDGFASWSMDDSVCDGKEIHVLAHLKGEPLGPAGPHLSGNAEPAAEKLSRPDTAKNQLATSDSVIDAAERLCKGNEDQSALTILLPVAASDSLGSPLRVKALNLLQHIYIRQRRFDAAVSVMEKLLTLNIPPLRKEMLLFEIASIKASNLQKYSDARRDLQRYLLEYPTGVFAEEALLKSAELSFITKDYLIAKEEYQSYSNRFPKGAGATAAADRMAYLCDIIFHDWNCAVEWYQRVIDLDAESFNASNAYFWRAQCWKKLGRKDKALEGYQEYLSRYPHGRWATEAMKNVRANGITSAEPIDKAP